MPHINLLFPFIEDSGNAFEMAATSLAKKLANVSAFRVSFTAESFGHFNHGRNATLWLKPLVAQCSDSATAKTVDAEEKTVRDSHSKLLFMFWALKFKL